MQDDRKKNPCADYGRGPDAEIERVVAVRKQRNLLDKGFDESFECGVEQIDDIRRGRYDKEFLRYMFQAFGRARCMRTGRAGRRPESFPVFSSPNRANGANL